MTVKFDHMHGIGFIADTFTVSIEVHNFGQTPARLVKFEAEWAIIDVGAWSDAYGPYSLASLPLGEIPPNFNIEEELGGSGLKPFHEQVLAGTHAFEVRARIDCRDGFGRDYSTFVRRYCTGSQYNVGKLRSSPKGNAMH
jgi:hypothetical protein